MVTQTGAIWPTRSSQRRRPSTRSISYDTLMRDTKHLTTEHAPGQDERRSDLVARRQMDRLHPRAGQGHGLQHLHRGGGDAAKAHCSPRMRAKQVFDANDFSPDGKTPADHLKCGQRIRKRRPARHRHKEDHWLTQDKWEISGGNFSPDGKSVTWTANVDGNTDIYVHDLGYRQDHCPAASQGRKSPRRRGVGLHPRWFALALLSQRPHCPQRCLGLYRGHWQIAADDTLTGRRHALGRHGRAAFWCTIPAAMASGRSRRFLYVPYNMPRNGQNAAIVYVHGGPDVADA